MAGEEDITLYAGIMAVVLGVSYFAYLILKKKLSGKEIEMKDIVEAGREVIDHKDEALNTAENIVERDLEGLKKTYKDHEDTIKNEVEDVIDIIKKKGDEDSG